MRISRDTGRIDVQGWLVAVLIALATQGVWWVVLAPADIVRAKRSAHIPSLTYRPAARPSEEGSMHPSPWSPIIFSLPSEMGFSRRLMHAERGIKPPLETPGGMQFFLERAPSDRSRWTMRPEKLTSMVSRVLAEIPAEDVEVGVFKVSEREIVKGVTVEFVEGFLPAEFVAVPFPETLEKPGVSWEASVYLEVDEAGHVSHVFIEKGMEPGRQTLDLLKTLYRWRLLYPGAARTGRLVIRKTADHADRTQGGEG